MQMSYFKADAPNSILGLYINSSS